MKKDNSDLMKRIIKASNNPLANQLTKSVLFTSKDTTQIDIPIFNIAFSGDFKVGFQSGITMFAGPTKHFKTNMGLKCVSAYQKHHPESRCIFFDSEHGASPKYLKSMGVDPDRVIHIPIKTVEQLKIEMTNILQEITRGDKIILFVDSIGNLASKKEVDDALDEKTTADMTRAKALKSLFRIITPYMTELDIPCIMINHTIQTMEMFSKQVMTGGTGSNYAPDTIFFIGKRQVKEGKEVSGFEFILKTHKSRSLKADAKFPVTVLYNGGIDPYSGLLDIAQIVGFVKKPKVGWYSRSFLVDGVMKLEKKSWRAKDTSCPEFWKPLFQHEPFSEAIQKEYVLGSTLNSEDIEQAVTDLLSSDYTDTISIDFTDSNTETVDLEDELDELMSSDDNDGDDSDD